MGQGSSCPRQIAAVASAWLRKASPTCLATVPRVHHLPSSHRPTPAALQLKLCPRAGPQGRPRFYLPPAEVCRSLGSAQDYLHSSPDNLRSSGSLPDLPRRPVAEALAQDTTGPYRHRPTSAGAQAWPRSPLPTCNAARAHYRPGFILPHWNPA